MKDEQSSAFEVIPMPPETPVNQLSERKKMVFVEDQQQEGSQALR